MGTQGEHASIWYSPAWALGVCMVSAQGPQLLCRLVMDSCSPACRFGCMAAELLTAHLLCKLLLRGALSRVRQQLAGKQAADISVSLSLSSCSGTAMHQVVAHGGTERAQVYVLSAALLHGTV